MNEGIPEGWMLTSINDTCEVLDSRRIPLNAQERATRRGYFPYYGANGVQGYIDDYIFDGEHVLLAEDGGHFDEYDSRPISYLVDGKFWVNNHAHILKVKEGNQTRFIHYCLVHKNILKHINGGTRAKLNQADMRDIELLAPPPPEQQKIASILTSVDAVIEKTEAQISKLQDLKKGMMQELLTKGIGHTEYKDSPVGRIPKGWEAIPFGNVSALQRGFDITKSKLIPGPYPVVSSSGIGGYHNEFTTDGPGVVVGRKGSIGSVHFLKGAFSAHDTSLFVTDFFGNNEKFIYYLMLHLDLEKYGTKSGSPSLNRNDIHPLKVAIPPRSEQDLIADVLTNIDERICLLRRRLEKVSSTKKALMQDLLTGTVRVKVN